LTLTTAQLTETVTLKATTRKSTVTHTGQCTAMAHTVYEHSTLCQAVVQCDKTV